MGAVLSLWFASWRVQLSVALALASRLVIRSEPEADPHQLAALGGSGEAGNGPC